MKRKGETLTGFNSTKSPKPPTQTLLSIVQDPGYEAIVKFQHDQLPLRMRDLMLKFKEVTLTHVDLDSVIHVITRYNQIMVNALCSGHISDEEREKANQSILKFSASRSFLHSIKSLLSLMHDEITEENYRHKLDIISQLLNKNCKKELPLLLYIKLLANPEHLEELTFDIQFRMHQLEIMRHYLNEISGVSDVCSRKKILDLMNIVNDRLLQGQSLLDNLLELQKDASHIIINTAESMYDKSNQLSELDELQDFCDIIADNLQNFELAGLNLQEIHDTIQDLTKKYETFSRLYYDMATIGEFIKSKGVEASSSHFSNAFMSKIEALNCVLVSLNKSKKSVLEIEQLMMEDLEDLVAL